MDSVKIESARGVGYNLVGDIGSLKDIKDESIKKDFDRISYILKKIILLYNGDTLKIENLADEMYVSLSTIKNDLKEVKKILKMYNLKVISKHKLGIGIDGDKNNLTRCIIEISLKYEDINIEDFFSEFVSLNIISIRNEILNKLENENIIFTDYEFNNMFNYILLYLSLENKINYKDYIDK
ncbi:helix-turn-helix domain-containing protein, partial [Paraclostridium sp. AKS81]|uniref:helix-turn-helix domain-containing protein n=1 Tax=Paraclostridium sp. AKS81 TaxID=2876117 RepID=UPI0021DF70B9